MDYEAICAMKTRDGDPLLIIAGVSVTRTLPAGSPSDVRREMKWLVEHGPRTGLILDASGSITPSVVAQSAGAHRRLPSLSDIRSPGGGMRASHVLRESLA